MPNEKPNVIIMYADDLGYGDLGCYGACEIPTPNIDRLAENGVRFFNCHSPAATCTPARYSMMTGRYPFRNSDAKILPGDACNLIPEDMNTLPKVFRSAGYATGLVGKWHIGLGRGRIDWNQEIENTPRETGFDYTFIFPATADRVPCVYVENGRVVNLDPNDPIEVSYAAECPYDDIPTYHKNPELLKLKSSHGHDFSIVNGGGRIGYMRGGAAALWRDEELAETFSERAKSFVEAHRDESFFLYYALHQPHVPRLPSPRFAGATKLGPRGDVIAEMDWCVGELMNKLEELGLVENTIVIFSTDNGPVLDDGYDDRAVELCGAHKPAGVLRGGKYSMFEGGTRVPMILSWPGKVRRTDSDALVCHVDFMASFAAMLGVPLGEDDAPDSENLLSALFGDDPVGRDWLVTQGGANGSVLCHERWAYLAPNNGPAYNKHTDTELGNSKSEQLYNLLYDISQQQNLADTYPEVLDLMRRRLDYILHSERTRK